MIQSATLENSFMIFSLVQKIKSGLVKHTNVCIPNNVFKRYEQCV